MGAPPIIRYVYEEHLSHFGEPDGSIMFNDPPPPPGSGWPERIDVLHWLDTDDLDIVTFATIGMADRPMNGCDFRCELHFSIRAKAETLNLNKISHFCACMALYPFMYQTHFDWAHLIENPGKIPYFPNCISLLLHPAFIEDGWDSMDFNGTKIKIMNLIPITQDEVNYRKENGPFSIFDYFFEHQTDMFVNRS